MSSDKLAESPEHRKMVKSLIDKLVELGFEITQAAYNDYPEPSKIGRHEPDIKAYKRDEELVAIGEAKTCEDLRTEQTAEQFQDFSNKIMTNGKSKGKDVPFHIVVPNDCKNDLKEKLKELGLDTKPNITRWHWG